MFAIPPIVRGPASAESHLPVLLYCHLRPRTLRVRNPFLTPKLIPTISLVILPLFPISSLDFRFSISPLQFHYNFSGKNPAPPFMKEAITMPVTYKHGQTPAIFNIWRCFSIAGIISILPRHFGRKENTQCVSIMKNKPISWYYARRQELTVT